MSFSATDLCDERPDETRVLDPVFQSYGGWESFSGPVRTVRVHEDNVLVEEALGDLKPVTILVVDGGSRRRVLLGDRLAEVAASRRLGGVILYGCVWDTAALARAEAGILALAAHPRKSRKSDAGERDVAVELVGTRLSPGEYVCTDQDDVIVARRELG